MPSDERVLVIPTSHFRTVGYFHGFRPADEGYRARLLDPRQFSFQPRSKVETDPAYKQLIPYVVLRCGEEIFQYRRGSSGTEARLRALRSTGIGGHISEDDAHSGGDAYQVGMHRELSEEVEIQSGYRESLFGFINDDSTLVGSVHLGVVHLVELELPNVTSREDALAEAGFVSISQAIAERDQFETWSQFVFEAIGGSVDV